MTLVNWDPFRELEDVLGRWSRTGGRNLPASEGGTTVNWRPAANISETDNAYVIKAELPEVKKDDVEVSVHDGVITIKGERRFEKTDDTEKTHRIESFYGSFSRSFSLPADVDESRIAAESRDGVLTVRLPKLPVETPKAIEIKVD
ncbi:MAG: Hsp20/alpha crystallin family protein [Gammaproteobacteria bacterium]|nr:Hsp20/alpha crystallin family protein [Gammaproteobacteria bacterium]